MRLYDQILAMNPLVSYEDDRAKNGPLTLISVDETRTLTKGVTYRKCLYRRGNGLDVRVYLTTVAPDAKAKFAVSACPLKTIKPVMEHAADWEDGDVLYAMNAGFFHFFNNGDRTPYGIQIERGVVMALPGRDKPQFSTFFFAITKDGRPIISDADTYYESLHGTLEYAVGGSHMLIRGGTVTLHEGDEMHPRTAVGIASDGTVIMMCCDGRSEISAGMTYGDIIDLYTHLGYEITDLLNLDGGGSTTVVLHEEDGFAIQNMPSGPPSADAVSPADALASRTRPVADAILLIAE